MKKTLSIIGLILIGLTTLGGSLTYTTAEVENAVRLVLTPAHLALQLEENGTVDTVLTNNIPRQIGGATNLMLVASRDFTYNTTNDLWVYTGTGTNVPLSIDTKISYSTTTVPAHVVWIRATTNDVAIPGVFAERTISGASTVGVVTLGGHITINYGDTLGLWAESDSDGTLEIHSFSTDIKEEAE